MNARDNELFAYINMQLNLSNINDEGMMNTSDRAARMVDDINAIIERFDANQKLCDMVKNMKRVENP